jgi:hypothetical protein
MKFTPLSRFAIAAFCAGLFCAIFCRWICGVSLGLFFGPVALGAILIPPFSLLFRPWIERVFLVGAIVDGVGVVWFFSIFGSSITFGQWLWCYLIWTAFAFALAGATWMLAAVRVNVFIASGTVVTIAMAWLSWPIWLSQYLSNSIAQSLIKIHPLFAIDGLVQQLGIWSEQSAFYRMSNLGQDVPYHLPGVSGAILFHALVALLGIGLATLTARRQRGDVLGAGTALV